MTLAVVETVAQVREAVRAARSAGKSIGFVPTMGALHEGHVSLIRAARPAYDFVVVSIFVNPTQFGPHEDFDRYPRMFAQDVALCEACGADLVFHPSVNEVYSPGFATFVQVEKLQDVLEGASRPGHFRGVCTIVLKLFQMVLPDRAFFGQKDAQQVAIIQKMVRDLNLPVEIVVCPTARAADGLALSSRNQYLTAEQRLHAVCLYRALEEARGRIQQGERSADTIRQVLSARISATPGAALDYAAVVAADSLQPCAELKGRMLLALAVRFGSTRLIDNVLLDLPT